MKMNHIQISSLEDIEATAALVGLPVGPRTGSSRRTKEKKEWYVALGFLKSTIPAQFFSLPIAIRNGRPPHEPDFVMTRQASNDAIALIEITEATNQADQREMAAIELSDKAAILVGELGGRFYGGASRPGLVWASDIVDAIKRKSGKAIFQDLAAARHLIVYPNSNASALLFDSDAELSAIQNLRDEIAKDLDLLARIANGCSVHVLGKYNVCIDVMGDMRVVAVARVTAANPVIQ
jgi:hypothetical protein